MFLTSLFQFQKRMRDIYQSLWSENNFGLCNNQYSWKVLSSHFIVSIKSKTNFWAKRQSINFKNISETLVLYCPGYCINVDSDGVTINHKHTFQAIVLLSILMMTLPNALAYQNIYALYQFPCHKKFQNLQFYCSHTIQLLWAERLFASIWDAIPPLCAVPNLSFT